MSILFFEIGLGGMYGMVCIDSSRSDQRWQTLFRHKHSVNKGTKEGHLVVRVIQE